MRQITSPLILASSAWCVVGKALRGAPGLCVQGRAVTRLIHARVPPGIYMQLWSA